jgi:hypothetical protein
MNPARICCRGPAMRWIWVYALSNDGAEVTPAPLICRNGSKDNICNQLICGADDRFGSLAAEDGKAKRPLTPASPQIADPLRMSAEW